MDFLEYYTKIYVKPFLQALLNQWETFFVNLILIYLKVS